MNLSQGPEPQTLEYTAEYLFVRVDLGPSSLVTRADRVRRIPSKKAPQFKGLKVQGLGFQGIVNSVYRSCRIIKG